MQPYSWIISYIRDNFLWDFIPGATVFHCHSDVLKRVIHSDAKLHLVHSHSKQLGCFHSGPVNDLNLLWSERWNVSRKLWFWKSSPILWSVVVVVIPLLLMLLQRRSMQTIVSSTWTMKQCPTRATFRIIARKIAARHDKLTEHLTHCLHLSLPKAAQIWEQYSYAVE